MKPRHLFWAFLGLAGCSGAHANAEEAAKPTRADKVVKTDAEWKKQLPPLAYDVLRHQATEAAFSGPYGNDHRHAVYHCAACNLPVFKSEDKFDSGTGWPSFTRPIAADAVATTRDEKFGMARVEVHCPRCGGHLGHVFEDGPAPTGLRYCINGVSLKQELVK
ncbi:MAG: Peptide methionine sulfoxide reductase MsrB [Myxococcales bacterium]|nr:Peptide methionine sulfoxide reductase MsrB [Myxococcales bacterium]